MIPAAAVEAVALILASSECSSIEREPGLGSGDNVTHEDLAIFLPYARERARQVLEAAAPYMQLEELLAGVQRDIDAVKTMTEVLVDHQRQNSSGCLCGWAKLGHSHPEHQAEALNAAGFGQTNNPYRSQP